MKPLSFALVPLVLMAAPAFASDAPSANTPVPALLEELAKYQDAENTVAEHIDTFDTLDFDVYTHQKWDRLCFGVEL